MGVADVMVLLPAPVVFQIFGQLVRMEWIVLGVLYGIRAGTGALLIMLFCSAFYLIGRARDDVLSPRLRRC